MEGNATEFAATMLAFTVALVPLTGIMTIVTPFLMRRGEVFAVTVPDTAAHDPYLRRLKRCYALIMSALTAVLTAVGAFGAFTGDAGLALAVLCVGMLLLCVGSYGLMLYFRAKVQSYKKEQGWQASARESVAVVGDAPVPRAVSLKWNLLYLPVIAVTLAIGAVGYAQMPDLIPQHMNFQGEVTEYMEKTPFTILVPALIVAFVAACMAFAHWTILRSKRPSNPSAPATSALAYGMFARAQSILLVAGGLALSLLGPVMELSFIGVIGLGQAGVFVVALALVIVVGSIVISLVYGQGGSRVFSRMAASERLLADDDEHWKLGVFYYNPDDASLFLPERFGIGWTMNWARPAVWAIMLAGLVLTVAFVVVVMMLM
ncbi:MULTISPECIES: DUF1648 domain-containing protein [Gordonibacter]|jgi:uncharacterized membrane protein|uniref:DUF1648 domain-containing protein n=1 Tax=Gordonibacter urolithinfaciens TaxID=1335613 RepID=A0A423UH88_9ACTN|nr:MULTISPECIES: DUF5808 domain-containing protein [Gordonibacter]GKG89265.1 membrane protein [Gordonibacter pamelaeae]MCB6560909.1 DUF1648 domain-containing protein [Gordonibacter urolithinfaciens]MCB7084770.1 DUF1648 domain-containing protein [Gordonibacter urolithinfaciens]MDN4469224.1 DUF1648 domain-containing protein [Gordonibacter sp. RACS_AR68]MSA95064.1 DUF1648 domain-containing protein [Gordonibacter urolithinfaciens]